MKHATGTIRGGHNPKRPYRATAASRRCTTPRCRIGRPGAMASAAPAWPQAALQRFKALEPAPFVPQRLGLHLLEAPKPPTARPRVVAAACALAAAWFLGAETERSQQSALRAPHQIGTHARWPRQPLFEREPPRKASRRSALHGLPPFSSSSPGIAVRRTASLRSPMTRRSMELRRTLVGPNCTRPFGMDHRVKPGGDEQRVKPGDDKSLRSRSAAAHPSFADAKKSQAKSVPKNSSLERREAERR